MYFQGAWFQQTGKTNSPHLAVFVLHQLYPLVQIRIRPGALKMCSLPNTRIAVSLTSALPLGGNRLEESYTHSVDCLAPASFATTRFHLQTPCPETTQPVLVLKIPSFTTLSCCICLSFQKMSVFSLLSLVKHLLLKLHCG